MPKLILLKYTEKSKAKLNIENHTCPEESLKKKKEVGVERIKLKRKRIISKLSTGDNDQLVYIKDDLLKRHFLSISFLIL